MYYLRVLLSGPEMGGCGSTDAGAYRDADALEVAKRFYLLSYSLRTMAPDGSVLVPGASTVTDSRSPRTR